MNHKAHYYEKLPVQLRPVSYETESQMLFEYIVQVITEIKLGSYD